MFNHKNITILCITAIILLAIAAVFTDISWWYFLIIALFWGAAVSWGAFDIRLGYFLPGINRLRDPGKKEIALTFDDGPSAFTIPILELLEQYNAKATFFCIGQAAERYPEILNKISYSGHCVGNHSYSHSNLFGFFSKNKVMKEIRQTDLVIENISGHRPSLFRPPFGVTNPHIAGAVRLSGHKVIGWSIRTLDTVIHNDDKIFKKVIKRIKPGSIILFHDTAAHTVKAIEKLLLFLQSEKYSCVTIEQLIQSKQ